MTLKSFTKSILESWPYSAELYQTWLAKDSMPAEGFRLDRLDKYLLRWTEAVVNARQFERTDNPKRVLLIGCLPWWLEYVTAMGLLLSGVGHEVEIAYSPYRRWTKAVPPFERRRQSSIIQSSLFLASPLIRSHDLSQVANQPLKAVLEEELKQLSLRDVQYSMQREELDLRDGSEDSALYALRFSRNKNAAQRVLEIIDGRSFDCVIIPNGSILEFGAAMLAARALDVPITTFEFGEQRERMWLSQNDEVMRLDTSALWDERGKIPLTAKEVEAIRDLYRARTKGETWGQFGRQWQKGDGKGINEVRANLNLDSEKPLVLLCTNVVGDSLALGRQIFTEGMSDWLTLTVQHLAQHADIQLIVRVHPGELLGAGHPSTEIVSSALPDLPANIKVIPPDSPINTYELIEIADLGLVYTTTVGLEMAMWGVPVIVAGQTHYRNKGFTMDAESMEQYLSFLDQNIQFPAATRLEVEKIELAWRYAYRFFFEYPFRFPWHLIGFWDDVEDRPMEAVFQVANLDTYRQTIQALVGQPIDWSFGGLH